MRRQVVAAAPRQGFIGNDPGGGVEIRRRRDGRANARGIGVLVDPVGSQQEQVAGLQLQRQVIDLDLAIHAQRPRQVALLRRHPDAMVLGQLLELLAAQAVDAGIANMEQVGRGGLDDQGAEGAHVAALAVVAMLAAAGSANAARN